MKIPPLISDILIPVVCILLTIVLRIFLCVYDQSTKNKNSASKSIINSENDKEIQQKKICILKTLLPSVPSFVQGLCFILPTISGIFIFNAIFKSFERHGFEIESVMTYSDTLLAMVSLVASMAIAFFQYKTQESIDNYQKAIKAKDDAQHINEIRSEQFRSLRSLEGVCGYAVNYNITEAFIHSEKRKTDKSLLICIGDKTQSSDPIFYHPFFAPVDGKQWSDCISCKECDNLSVSEISPHHACIELNASCKQIVDFLTYPVKKKLSNTPLPKLHFLFKVNAIDQSISVDSNHDDSSEIKKYELSYEIEFEVEPMPLGYDTTGKFPICVTNVCKIIKRQKNKTA